MEKMIEIAKIVNVHGIKGEVRLEHFCDQATDLKDYKTFYTKDAEKLSMEGIRFLKDKVLVKFKEIEDIDQAQGYKDKTLYIKKQQLKRLKKGVFYIHDLIGCGVFLPSGQMLGKISDVLKTGANDVYVIDKENKQYLIPAIKEVIDSVDIEKRVIKITPIKGMLNDED